MRVSVSCVRCRMEVSGVADDLDEAVARLLNNLGLHLRGRRCRNRRRAMSTDRTTAPSDVAQTGGGPTTHAPAREPLSGFRWPCERRDAHGPHNAYADASPSEFCPVCGRERGQSHARSDCDGECPGVDAHPLTMIGGRYRDDRE